MINMDHLVDVASMAMIFYLIDLFWKDSKIYKDIIKKRFFNKKINKIFLLIISIGLVIICILLENRFSGYLVANDSFELIIKGIPLISLYIISSFIFTNNNSKESTNT